MNERYDAPVRDIMTKEKLYNGLNTAIEETRLTITREEARLGVLIDTKRNLDEYFDDLNADVRRG